MRRNAKVGMAMLVGVAALIAGPTARTYGQTVEPLNPSWSLDAVYNVDETLNSAISTTPMVTVTEGQSDGIVDGFNSTTLHPGDILTFSGTITFPVADQGGDQFRIGLMNTNGNNPATTDTSWLGYLAEFPNNSDHSLLLGARANPPASSGNWASGTGLTSFTSQTNTSTTTVNAPGTPVTENFSLTLVYNGSGPNTFSTTMVSSDATYNVNSSGTDPGTDTSTEANAVYNEVGIFFGSSTFGGTNGTTYQTNFSNLAVTYTPVPEPAAATLLGLSSLGLLARRRRNSVA